jgi:hypothetical protein
MNSLPVNEKIQKWLGLLPKTLPIGAVQSGVKSAEGKRLSALIADSGLASESLVVAMLWLRVGIIEPAHEIVQDGATPLASYLHGVVHRLEGDYWNAKYWFRQVHDKRLLQSVSIAMVERIEKEGLLTVAKSLNFVQGSQFSPAEFVTAHEQMNQQSKTAEEQKLALESMALCEWESLWQVITNMRLLPPG